MRPVPCVESRQWTFPISEGFYNLSILGTLSFRVSYPPFRLPDMETPVAGATPRRAYPGSGLVLRPGRGSKPHPRTRAPWLLWEPLALPAALERFLGRSAMQVRTLAASPFHPLPPGDPSTERGQAARPMGHGPERFMRMRVHLG